MTDAAAPLPAQSAGLPEPIPAAPQPMSERTRLGLAVLGGAILLGTLGDRLLWTFPWGINITLWTLAFAAVAYPIARRRDPALAPYRTWPLAVAVLAAAGVAWRDSTTLKLLDVLALLGALCWLVLPDPVRFVRLGLADHIWAGLVAGFDAAFGAFALGLSQIRWPELSASGSTRQLLAAGRGLLIAVPLLLLFGGLLMAADAAFESIISHLIRINVSELVLHTFAAGCLAWLVAGFLYGALLPERKPGAAPIAGRPFALGGIETAIVLGLLDALFLGFVLVQFRYFFGGAALVEASVGLTYAQYARAGFFELVWVAALVLPVLLGLHWLLRADDRIGHRLYRGLAGATVLLLCVIMVSAVQRMRLYQAEYGLTELRLYTTAFMGWLALVFLWFAGTVLRERRELFAAGAFAAAGVMLLGLHALNPDDLIVRVNVARVDEGRPLDPVYLTNLSADAVPALAAAAPLLPADARSAVETFLRRRWLRPADPDWRSWSVARELAWSAVGAPGERFSPLPAGSR